MSQNKYDRIVVQINSFGAPGRFYWQGRSYHIDTIERIWRSSPGKRRGMRVYKVRSRNRSFMLHYDRRLRQWSLLRAPWRTRLGLSIERLAARVAA